MVGEGGVLACFVEGLASGLDCKEKFLFVFVEPVFVGVLWEVCCELRRFDDGVVEGGVRV